MSYETRVLNIFETLLKENRIRPKDLERACSKFDEQNHEKVKNIYIMLDLLSVYSFQNLDPDVPEFRLFQKMLRFMNYPIFLSPLKFDVVEHEQNFIIEYLDEVRDAITDYAILYDAKHPKGEIEC